MTKTIGLLFLDILLIVASVVCVIVGPVHLQIVGWCGVVFFGLGFFAFAARLFQTGPAVVVNESGIQYTKSSSDKIPWADIESLWVGVVHSQRFLCVELIDNEAFVSRLKFHQRILAKANARLGFPPICISLTGLSPTLNELWEYLRANHPEKLI